MTSQTPPEPDCLIGFQDLKTIYNIRVTRMTLYRWERDGLFPKRCRPTPNSSRFFYLKSEIERWIAERAAARHTGNGTASELEIRT